MHYRLPPLNTLRIFEAIYRHGSIRKAASELCLTPQAVSQQLKILETSLGQQLFRRTIRSLAYIPHIVRANNSQLARRGAALAGYVWGGCVASMMRSEFSSHSRKSFRRDR